MTLPDQLDPSVYNRVSVINYTGPRVHTLYFFHGGVYLNVPFKALRPKRPQRVFI